MTQKQKLSSFLSHEYLKVLQPSALLLAAQNWGRPELCGAKSEVKIYELPEEGGLEVDT